MLTMDDFDKAEGVRHRSSQRVVMMTPKRPIAGLDDLEITIFATNWKQGDSVLWAWEWTSGGRNFQSSLGKDDNPPVETHLNLFSAASAAIGSVSYWSDDERLPREQRKREEQERRQASLDNQIDRFLES